MVILFMIDPINWADFCLKGKDLFHDFQIILDISKSLANISR